MHVLSMYRVAHADNARLRYVRMLKESFFHLERRNVGAIVNNDVFLAADEPE